MNVVDIIARKRDGHALSKAELTFFVQGVTAGRIPDYQTSAWLMATYLRGMTPQETLDLTLAMRDSGQVITFPDGMDATLDKHSTGGVGDKTTLVVVPILAAAGVPMLKMSGRGLGFSGGTVDKLESIPGFRTDLSIAEALSQVQSIGAALIGQTAELAPADKILYGLRDVTATVECIPLIASSIMSKKLAGGASHIVLDVKVGRGAFMKTQERAEELARAMCEIGRGAGVPTVAVLTRMDEPLGSAVGNALEVREAMNALRGSEDELKFLDLCWQLAGHGLIVSGKAKDEAEATSIVARYFTVMQPIRQFERIVAAQGGPRTLADIEKSLPTAPIQHDVMANQTGYVMGIDAETVGKLSVEMGAGRLSKADTIDPSVGIVLHAKTGAKLQAGKPLATLHCRESDRTRIPEFTEMLLSSYTFAPEPPADLPYSLIISTIH
jgi:pyrimidine-nucleoside phosphorylase